jgi:hypothetical protein
MGGQLLVVKVVKVSATNVYSFVATLNNPTNISKSDSTDRS